MTMPLLKALLAVLSLAAAAPLPQYEPNPELQASEILSPQQLRGEDHAVREIVLNDGFLNQYVVAANTLLQYGVRVFAYPGMSHIKAAIYDGWACVGSANFDKLSFQVNKETNLGSSDPAFVRDLIAKVFDPDFAAAAELQELLPAGSKNTFASIVASQL